MTDDERAFADDDLERAFAEFRRAYEFRLAYDGGSEHAPHCPQASARRAKNSGVECVHGHTFCPKCDRCRCREREPYYGRGSGESAEPTKYALRCHTHGMVFLTREEYGRQLADADRFWTCPRVYDPMEGECGMTCGWDEDHYEAWEDAHCEGVAVDVAGLDEVERLIDEPLPGVNPGLPLRGFR